MPVPSKPLPVATVHPTLHLAVALSTVNCHAFGTVHRCCPHATCLKLNMASAILISIKCEKPAA